MEEETAKDPSSDDQVNTIEVRNVRSYDCVFCKRGFSSAQALGGHMNIHRRDRARIRDSSTSSPLPSSPPPVVVMMAGNARPDHNEEIVVAPSGYIFGTSSSSSFNQQDVRPFFPLVSEEPSMVKPYQPMQMTTSAMAEEEKEKERWHARGKGEVDPEKMQELIRYGKELELGLMYRSVGGGDKGGGGEEKEHGGVNLNLGL